jgi:type II restriction/modification system DNA methylase subunit YeeA
VIDFIQMPESQAALYELPFEYVRRTVKPVRDRKRDKRMRVYWWLHGRRRPALRKALKGKLRCIITPEVAKHRVFVWMNTEVVPDHKLHVFARDDDYFLGVLHSRVHELWALRKCSTLEDRPSYNSETTFETFPFPWPPGKEAQDAPRVK